MRSLVAAGDESICFSSEGRHGKLLIGAHCVLSLSSGSPAHHSSTLPLAGHGMCSNTWCELAQAVKEQVTLVLQEALN